MSNDANKTEGSSRHTTIERIAAIIKMLSLIVFVIGLFIIAMKNHFSLITKGFSFAYNLYIISIIFICFSEKTDRDFKHIEISALVYLQLLRPVLSGAIQWFVPFLSLSGTYKEVIEIINLLFAFFCDTFYFTTCLSLVIVSIIRRTKPRKMKLIEIGSYNGEVDLLRHRIDPVWLYYILIPLLILGDIVVSIVKGSLSFIVFVLDSIITLYNIIIHRWMEKLRVQNDTYIVRLTVKVSVIAALSVLYVYISTHNLYSEAAKDIFGYFSTVIIIPMIMSQIDTMKDQRKKC